MHNTLFVTPFVFWCKCPAVTFRMCLCDSPLFSWFERRTKWKKNTHTINRVYILCASATDHQPRAHSGITAADIPIHTLSTTIEARKVNWPSRHRTGLPNRKYLMYIHTHHTRIEDTYAKYCVAIWLRRCIILYNGLRDEVSHGRCLPSGQKWAYTHGRI